MDRHLIDEICTNHFSKKFEFRKQRTWTLPQPVELWCGEEWVDEKLIRMKEELNSAKSQLNDKERGPWRTHTQSTNPAGTIVSNLKRRFKPQLCTQAWAKFYEILANYEPLLLELSSYLPLISTLHLCESPGAFVSAFNHFLTLNCPKRKKSWRWIGTTLNPYFEGNSQDCMIADDRFIMHTLDNWEFGRDNTGDIMNLENLEQLEQRTKKFGIISLITADGSIDCHTNPSEQESKVAKLHYCEVVTALSLLGNNGNFVIKMFTFFESSAVVLMYLLTCAFKSIHVFKPGTSKAGNSEVYVICLNYQQHLMKNYDRELKRIFDQPSNCRRLLLSRNQIPDEFVNQIYECSSFFKDIQVTVINRNIELYPNMSINDRQHYDELQSACLHYFIRNFRIGKIKDVDLIVQRNKMNPLSKDLFPINTSDTFNDVRERLTMSRGEKLQLMADELKGLMPENWCPDEMVTGEISAEELSWNHFTNNCDLFRKETIVMGRSIKSIQSSRFSYQYLLNLWNDFVNEIPACESNGSADWKASDFPDLITQHFSGPHSNVWLLDITNSNSFTNINGLTAEFKHVDLLESVMNLNSNNNGKGDEPSAGTMAGNIPLEKLLWIEALLFVLKQFKPKDCLILIAGNFLTRFIVGCLYILTHWFTKTKLVRPMSLPPENATSIIIFHSYQNIHSSSSNCVGGHFNSTDFFKFVQNCLTTQTDKRSVLEIVPVLQLISDENFFSWLYEFNKKKMGQQLYKLLNIHNR